jgi:OmpA-OmpF porin, OOP family
MRMAYGVAAAAVLTVMMGGSALADGGPKSAYVGAGGAVVLLPDQNLDTPPASKLDSDLGWGAGGAVGVRWDSGFRTELEAMRRENDFKLKPGTKSGDVTSTSLMLNVIYDFGVDWGVTPYLGVGAGYGWVGYHGTAYPGGPSLEGGIYQGIAGVSVPITDKLEGFADYRYFRSTRNAPGGHDEYDGHEAMFGIRYTFWEEPKPMAAAPAPAPMAQPKDYVIYFEFNKANITKAAGSVLDELKATSGGSSVSVVGHTDTVGSAAYNQKLSEKRAKNTGTALDQRGVKVDSVSGKGFSEPAVNTGPGVKEPLNRRAVITLSK